MKTQPVNSTDYNQRKRSRTKYATIILHIVHTFYKVDRQRLLSNGADDTAECLLISLNALVGRYWLDYKPQLFQRFLVL